MHLSYAPQKSSGSRATGSGSTASWAHFLPTGFCPHLAGGAAAVAIIQLSVIALLQPLHQACVLIQGREAGRTAHRAGAGLLSLTISLGRECLAWHGCCPQQALCEQASSMPSVPHSYLLLTHRCRTLTASAPPPSAGSPPPAGRAPCPPHRAPASPGPRQSSCKGKGGEGRGHRSASAGCSCTGHL